METAAAQLRFSGFSRQCSTNYTIPRFTNPNSLSLSFPFSTPLNPSLRLLPSKPPTPSNAGGGGTGGTFGGNGGDGGSGGGDSSSDNSSSSSAGFGVLGLFLNGWRSRVVADPQFPFKVLMEEVVGVSSCIIGDMASRPNFGLNELDFVFSTLVVGAILNFTLMYLLAPTAAATSQTLPAIFANCPTSHMFEPGTELSNGLIKMRKTMDPSFETPNKPPPTVLNALTCLNNVLGGMTFVLLARMTGSQSVKESKPDADGVGSAAPEKEKLLDGGEEVQSNQSTFK
ncbi:hypothetical protein OIU76_030590 [Salix suchowensis]|nr:hypothetical protein OIU76_030590 [Salix suchowensis]